MGDRFWEVGLSAKVTPSEVMTALGQTLLLNLRTKEVEPDSGYYWDSFDEAPTFTIEVSRSDGMRFLVSVVTPVSEDLLWESAETFTYYTKATNEEALALKEHHDRFLASKSLALIQLYHDWYEAKIATAAVLMSRWDGIVVRNHAGTGPYIPGHGFLIA